MASVHVLSRAPLNQILRWEQVCSLLGKRCKETFGQDWGGGAESQSERYRAGRLGVHWRTQGDRMIISENPFSEAKEISSPVDCNHLPGVLNWRSCLALDPDRYPQQSKTSQNPRWCQETSGEGEC